MKQKVPLQGSSSLGGPLLEIIEFTKYFLNYSILKSFILPQNPGSGRPTVVRPGVKGSWSIMGPLQGSSSLGASTGM